MAVTNRKHQSPRWFQRARTILSRGEPLLFLVFAGALTLFVARYFFSSIRLQTLFAEYSAAGAKAVDATKTAGPWSAPLDDVFIHFDFARSIARGHPFEWSEGGGYSSGGTSLLYPFVLAIGYRAGFVGLELMEWAGVIACVSVFALLVASRRAFRELPIATSYLAPPALLGIGALCWSLFSGMEVAFYLALWGGAYLAWDDLTTEVDSSRFTAKALLLGLWGAALVSARPEGAVTVAVCSLSAAFFLRRFGRRACVRVVVLSAIPGVLVVAASMITNYVMTGDATAAGALAKLEYYHPHLTSFEVLKSWGNFLYYQVGRLSNYHFATVIPFGWIPWLFALAALVSPKTRRPAALLWLSIFTWFLVVALNGQVRWQNERYSMPAVAWLMLAAALGLGAIFQSFFEAPRDRKRATVGGLAVVLVLLFAGFQAKRYRHQIWFFGRASKNILEQHMRVGTALRYGFDTPPRRVLLGDAGAIPYVSDLPALDVIGLGGYRGYPFARATRLNIAAAAELIEHIERGDRPDVFALYPTWWGDFPDWFGRRIVEVPIRGNVICGSSTKVIYKADWSALEGSATPVTLAKGERVLWELDSGDLLSERASNYRQIPSRPAYVAPRVLPDPRNPARDLFDAARSIAPGVSERFTLRGLSPGKPLRLLVRTANPHSQRIPITAAGKSLGYLDVPGADGWAESSIELPPPASDELVIEIGPTRYERSLFHFWAVGRP
jgi:hypothetical protein